MQFYLFDLKKIFFEKKNIRINKLFRFDKKNEE